MALQKEERGEYLGPEQAVPDEASTVERQRYYVTPETLQRVLRVRERLMQESGGHVFEESAELIHQMREERTRELEDARKVGKRIRSMVGQAERGVAGWALAVALKA